MRPEPPPTAGLPLRFGDLVARPPPMADVLAGLFGIEDALATCSGTAALVIALRVLAQRTPGRRKVVVPAYTCPLVALAVHACGLQVVCCEVSADGTNLDPGALEGLLDDGVLAVVATHLAGRVTDVGAVIAIAEPRGIAVIEDAAQGLGARSKGRSIGLLGHFGFFSMAVGKGLTTYEGGLLVSRDASLRAAAARQLACDAPPDAAMEALRCVQLLGYALLYRPRLLRLAYGIPLRRALKRGDDVAAAGDRFERDIPLHALGRWRQRVAASAAQRLPEFIEQSRVRAGFRVQRLHSIPGLHVATDTTGDSGTWPVLWLHFANAEWRQRALSRLWPTGVGVGPVFVHALPDYTELRDIVPDATVPVARSVASCSLAISNSSWLDAASFESVCQVIEAVRRA